MTIKVYIAGSSREKERARRFFERVRSRPDLSIAYDWLADVDASDAAGVRDFELNDDARAKFARQDLDGVATCDVLVVLAEHTPTGRGMWVELGFALGLRRAGLATPAIIVSGGDRISIFTAPSVVEFEVPFGVGSHDDEAFEILCGFANDFDFDEHEELRRARRCLASERAGREALRVRLADEERANAFGVGVLCGLAFPGDGS